MKNLMSWESCMNGHIRSVDIDNDKIKGILKMCDVRLRFLTGQIADNETASILSEGYYEIIKELLTALLLTRGMKSDNHECLISFLGKEYPRFEYEVGIIHELKHIRNRITYEGVFVKLSYFEKNRVEFEHIISMLKKILEGDVS